MYLTKSQGLVCKECAWVREGKEKEREAPEGLDQVIIYGRETPAGGWGIEFERRWAEARTPPLAINR